MDPVQTAPAGEIEEHHFHFSGTGREFFGIWIVNVALTVVTLGIYSAWAKVRTRQYFYGSTTLDGQSFRYTADPRRILIGRIIALLLSAGYFAVAHFLAKLWAPILAYLVLMMAAYPWLLVRTYAFNARYSLYRGIAFGFAGRYVPALKTYFLWALMLIPTFGFFYPAYRRRVSAFNVEQHRFGSQAFSFDGRTGDAYSVYLPVFVGGFLYMVFIFIVIMVGVLVVKSAPEGLFQHPWLKNSRYAELALAGLFYLLFLPGYLLSHFWVSAKYHNFLYNHVQLGPIRFMSTQRFRDILWIGLTNGLALLLSFGLAWPWARVRSARYRAAHLRVSTTPGALAAISAASQTEGSAVAQEIGTIFDYDLSL